MPMTTCEESVDISYLKAGRAADISDAIACTDVGRPAIFWTGSLVSACWQNSFRIITMNLVPVAVVESLTQ